MYTTVQMHRQLLGLGRQTPIVDHADGNGLNNQRENLRICSKSQNGANRRKKGRGTTSRYLGVSAHYWKNQKKWVAQSAIGGKSVYIGIFESELGAAAAYNARAHRMFGEYANLNQLL